MLFLKNKQHIEINKQNYFLVKFDSEFFLIYLIDEVFASFGRF